MSTPDIEATDAGAVSGESQGELSFSLVFTASSCMDANTVAGLWIAGIVVTLAVVVVVWLLRRSRRPRR